MSLPCYSAEAANSVPIILVQEAEYNNWLLRQVPELSAYLECLGFQPKTGNYCSLIIAGQLESVLCIYDQQQYRNESIAQLSLNLPARRYHLADCDDPLIYIGWGLGAYQFNRYKKLEREVAELVLPSTLKDDVEAHVKAYYLTRDLINTPAEDMTPAKIGEAMHSLADSYDANFKSIDDQAVLAEQFPALYAVGKGAEATPRLLEMTWGNEHNPSVTLVGKGISFDTGGLDLKASGNMRLMKKDMGGSANVLGLAQWIMMAKLPLHLRVVIPTAENAISGRAMRPGDIITMRNGKTVEVDNTDAEGRLVLADAVTYVTETSSPDILFTFATLTGAARVAVGTEIAAYFASETAPVQALEVAALTAQDPLWQLPLYQPYKRSLKTPFADLKNTGYSMGGAITAALFIEQFMINKGAWFHFDIMAYNDRPRPAHPEGGEAMGIAAAFHFLKNHLTT